LFVLRSHHGSCTKDIWTILFTLLVVAVIDLTGHATGTRDQVGGGHGNLQPLVSDPCRCGLNPARPRLLTQPLASLRTAVGDG